jgi:hypothetical protein
MSGKFSFPRILTSTRLTCISSQRKDQKIKKPKTQGEIAASFRSNRTTDSMIESRFARPTIAATLRGPEVKPEGLKSRVSAMLNRRPRAITAPTSSSANARINDTPVITRSTTQVATSVAAPAHVRTSDELFEAGLQQLNIALAALGQAAAKAAGTDETSQFTVRVRAIVERVTQINEARLARLDILTQLDGLAVAEVVGVSEAVEELNELTNEL